MQTRRLLVGTWTVKNFRDYVSRDSSPAMMFLGLLQSTRAARPGHPGVQRQKWMGLGEIWQRSEKVGLASRPSRRNACTPAAMSPSVERKLCLIKL